MPSPARSAARVPARSLQAPKGKDVRYAILGYRTHPVFLDLGRIQEKHDHEPHFLEN